MLIKENEIPRVALNDMNKVHAVEIEDVSNASGREIQQKQKILSFAQNED